MRHVAVTRWADLAAGRLGDVERRRALAHAAACVRCAAQRDRILAASAAMSDIARTPAPELGWDHIRARIYWAVSSERRAQERRGVSRHSPWWYAASAALAGAAVAAVITTGVLDPGQPLSARALTIELSAPVVQPEPAPTPVDLVPAALTGVVTMVAGDVDIDGATSGVDALDRPVIAGSVVRTAAGRAGVQFGAGSAFAVGPRSTVTVRHFDSAAIELAVEGEITIEVSKRASGQRFVVVAGDRTIEVRGTAFRVVHREETLEVACSHGRVAVLDTAGQRGEVEVAAGTSVAIAADEPLLAADVAPMPAAALAAMAASQAPRLPVWTDPAGLYGTSGPLVVAVAPGRGVRVDGVAIGRGAMALRVMSGRYLVEAERRPGHWSRGQWVEVGDGGARIEIEAGIDTGRRAPPVAVARSPEPSPADAAEREAQLAAALDHRRVSGCLRVLAKQGIDSDTFVELELGVDADGAVGFLNIVASDLPRSTAACVRDVVSAVRFPPGAAATWVHRLTF